MSCQAYTRLHWYGSKSIYIFSLGNGPGSGHASILTSRLCSHNNNKKHVFQFQCHNGSIVNNASLILLLPRTQTLEYQNCCTLHNPMNGNNEWLRRPRVTQCNCWLTRPTMKSNGHINEIISYVNIPLLCFLSEGDEGPIAWHHPNPRKLFPCVCSSAGYKIIAS